MRNLRRSKNRIKSFLHYYGENIAVEFNNNQWTLKFVSWLKEVKMQTDSGQEAFTRLIQSYEFSRKQLLDLSRSREYDRELYSLLNKISGIGPLTASALITELGDINWFDNIDHLGSYVGLVPKIRESGEVTHIGGITFRCNSFLRILLIESSWQAVRMDPAMMQYYHKHLINNTGHEVIIKVARKLLNRIDM